MNWEAMGAIGEIVGALSVILTIGYLAVQVRYAKSATTDQNRLVRAVGVLEMNRDMVANDEHRLSVVKNWGLTEDYERMARTLGVSESEASKVDFTNVYYFWLHWGQFASTHDEKDREEIRHLISTFYRSPGMKLSWETSPIAQPLLDPEFVDFVNGVLADDGD
jgi:hypothetical protein